VKKKKAPSRVEEDLEVTEEADLDVHEDADGVAIDPDDL